MDLDRLGVAANYGNITATERTYKSNKNNIPMVILSEVMEHDQQKVENHDIPEIAVWRISWIWTA